MSCGKAFCVKVPKEGMGIYDPCAGSGMQFAERFLTFICSPRPVLGERGRG